MMQPYEGMFSLSIQVFLPESRGTGLVPGILFSECGKVFICSHDLHGKYIKTVVKHSPWQSEFQLQLHRKYLFQSNILGYFENYGGVQCIYMVYKTI